MTVIGEAIAVLPNRIVAELVDPFVPGGPGGGGGNGGNPQPIGQEFLVDGEPLLPYVGWGTGNQNVVEGQTFIASVVLSRPLEFAGYVNVTVGPNTSMDLGTITYPDGDTVVFQPNETQKDYRITLGSDAASASPTALLLELILVEPTEPGPNDETPIATDSGQINDTLELLIEDFDPGATFTWTMASGDQEVVEGQTVVPFTVTLSEAPPAGETVYIRVKPAVASTAIAGTHYGDFDTVLRFRPPLNSFLGDTAQTFYVDFIRNSSPPVLPTLVIEGSVSVDPVSFPIDDGARTSFTVTIRDNSTLTGTPPMVTLFAPLQFPNEGQVSTVTARLESQGGTPFVFPVTTDVPFNLSYFLGTQSNPAGAADFTIISGGNGDSFRFYPFQETATVSVQVNPGAEVASEVRLDLRPAPAGSPYTIGSNPVVAIQNSGGSIGEATRMLVPSMNAAGGTRRHIQGIVAVVPPSTTLPEYSLAYPSETGERMQVVGMKRDGQGRYESAYVYGVAKMDESSPDEDLTAGILRLTDPANDIDPPEVAAGFTECPTLSFLVDPSSANGGAPNTNYTTSTGLTDSADAVNVFNWTGSDGFFASPWHAGHEVGPELVREKVHQMRPIAISGAPAGTRSSAKEGQSCGIIECTIRQMAGDDEVFIVEGEWHNGAWAENSLDPLSEPVDQFAENPYCDGEVNLERITVSLPAPGDYVIDLVDPHPSQTRGGSPDFLSVPGASQDLLVDRGTYYYFPPCAQYQFWFVVRKDNDSAKARAEDYLRLRNIAWFVGDLGPTRQPIYGDAGDLTLDYGRAGYVCSDTSTGGSNNDVVGWPAAKIQGEIQGIGTDTGEGAPGCLERWRKGIAPLDPSASISGVVATGARLGWWQSTGPAGREGAGGTNIYGASALSPWWGWWCRMRIQMSGVACRANIGFRDVRTWETAFWWQTSDGDPADPRVSVNGSYKHRAYSRHWHFNAPYLDADDYTTPSAPFVIGDWNLAPTSRPWNPVQETGGSEDPGKLVIRDAFPEEAISHIVRFRDGMNDMWYACRSRNAYVMIERMSSWMSRLRPPQPVVATYPNQTHPREWNLGQILPLLRANEDMNRRSVWLFPSSPEELAGSPQLKFAASSTRAAAWSVKAYLNHFTLAPDRRRNQMLGTDSSVRAKNGDVPLSQVEMLIEFFDRIIEDSGIFGRNVKQLSNPEPFGNSTDGGLPLFKAPDIPSRTGAYPFRGPVANYPGVDNSGYHTGFAPFFNMAFFVRAMAMVQRYCIEATSLPSDSIDRVFAFYDNYMTGVENFTLRQREPFVPSKVCATFGDNVVADAYDPAGPPLTSSTVAEVRDSKCYWSLRERNGGHPPNEFGNQFNKTGWIISHSARQLDDPGQLQWMKPVFSRRGESDEDLVRELMENIEVGLNRRMGFYLTNLKAVGEHTFMIPYIAALINQSGYNA